MKFKLSTAEELYKSEDVEALSKLGFSFTSYSKTAFKISGNPEIEFTTLAEFINFCNYWGQVIVNDDNEIMIYDGYVE
jgi:hypothetical protein